MGRMIRLVSGVLMAALLMVSCSGSSTSTGASRPSPRHASSRPQTSGSSNSSPTPIPSAGKGRSAPIYSHIAILVMENKGYGDIIGSADAPYTNQLADAYTLLTNSYGVAHPSLPNYLALIGGSTFGITQDCTDCYQGASNLVDQLESAGVSWKAYMQSMPEPCFTDPGSGDYAQKHDPFIYFDDIRQNAARCRRIVPLTQLLTDIGDRALPRYAFISPDLCADTHDCSIKTGDAFLRSLVPKVLPALGPTGILIITYDEAEGSERDASCCGGAHGGHIATIVAGPGAPRHSVIDTPADHYSILRLVEDNWGLPRLRLAGSPNTPSVPLPPGNG